MGRPALHDKLIKYPRYSRDQKKSVKLKSADVQKILYRYKYNGETIYIIAKSYGVSWSTIKSICDPEWARERRIRYRDTAMKWVRENPKRVTESTMETRRRKKRIQPEYKQYRLHKRFVSRRRKLNDKNKRKNIS